jgi:hypothetical protein
MDPQLLARFTHWVGHYSWAVVLVALLANALWLSWRARWRDEALRKGDQLIILGLVLMIGLPAVVMGAGILSGGAPDLWAFGRLAEHNPFVMAYAGVILTLDFALLYWIYLRGGDQFLAPHLPVLGGKAVAASPNAVRLAALTLVALQLCGLLLRTSMPVPPSF